MDLLDLMKSRHSVRQFTDKKIEPDSSAALNEEISAVNAESGLHIQLVLDEPEAFDAGKTDYGKFKCCKNYLVLAGPKGKDEEIGYFGERIVLKAQELGINSCWVALTYKKGKAHYELKDGEKLYMVIALGYGETQGHGRKSKSITDVSDYKDSDPEWYKAGIEAALLAPTAVNQQKFFFRREGEKVIAKAGIGFYTKVDLGIVKYHFDCIAGKGHLI